MLGRSSPRLLPGPGQLSEHEKAKAGLKNLVPEDAQQVVGHGVRARRSKSGAIAFELLKVEDGHAAV